MNGKPTKEDLRANNREARLARGWANNCPQCGRKFTSRTGFINHLTQYHKLVVKIGPGPGAPEAEAMNAPAEPSTATVAYEDDVE